MFLRVFCDSVVTVRDWIPDGSPLFQTGLKSPGSTLRSLHHEIRSESRIMCTLALYVGRLDQQKGLPDLLDAAERVIALKNNWHLALAGDGPCRDWLLDQISKRSAFHGKVHWLGRRDDIPNVLKSADVLVLASLWEGMPNSVLEAMAAGITVIGTAVEGTEDLVINGDTGWLVPPGDASTLAGAMLEATKSSDRLKRYGEAGHLRAEREFSLEATVAAYEQLWADVLGYRLENTKFGAR